MEPIKVIHENWLTHKPNPKAFVVTLMMTLLVFVTSYLILAGLLQADTNLIASPQLVFEKHNYWRAWTTLLAHADVEHLISNAFLFIPLTFLLYGYYGSLLFPVAGLVIGGLVNLIVLKNMPEATSLLGISGVVYWMGAVWLTLYLLIDRRKKLRYRFAIALFLCLTLFIPDKYQPQISYLSHLLGFIAGILTAFIYYGLNYKQIHAAEKIEYIYEQVEAPIIEVIGPDPKDLESN